MRIKYVVFFLVLAMLLSGCRKPVSHIPELVEPVSQESCYCPVGRGDIGVPEVIFATVVPVEYEHFFEDTAEVCEILVEQGDRVKKGDILARADSGNAEETLAEYQEELEKENETFRIDAEIAELEIHIERETGGKGSKKKIREMRENAAYDRLIHERRVRELKKQIRAQKKIVEKGVLRARHSGMVTYRMALGSAGASAGESIVTVSDMKDTYLMADDMTLDVYGEKKYRDYEVKYVWQGTEKIPVSEYDYPERERILAKVEKETLMLRMRGKKGQQEKLVVGNEYPILFIKKQVRDVLKIPKESLYTEGEEKFVYVRGEKSGDWEKRSVETGAEDIHDIEVAGGLKEGEFIYWRNDRGAIGGEDEYEIRRQDFNINSYLRSADSFSSADTACPARLSGRVAGVRVRAGSEVKKGDVLYVLDTDTKEAALEEQRYLLQKAKQEHKEQRREIDREIRGLKKKEKYRREILKLQRERAEAEYQSELRKLLRQYREMKRGNDGGGTVEVRAETEGTITYCKLKKGERAVEGEICLTMRTREKKGGADFLAKKPGPKEPAYFGRMCPLAGTEVTFNLQERAYTGICTGVGKKNRYYIRAEEKALSADDVETVTVTFPYIKIKDAIVVPDDMIYEEQRQTNTVYHYVWKLTERGPVKQYVVTHADLVYKGYQAVLHGLEEGDRICSE